MDFMRRATASAGAAAIVAALLLTRAWAQSVTAEIEPVPYMIVCGPTAQLEQALRGNGEAVAASGVASSSAGSGPVTQIWINPRSHDWTIVYAGAPDGRSCMVAAGTDMKPAPAAAKGEAL